MENTISFISVSEVSGNGLKQRTYRKRGRMPVIARFKAYIVDDLVHMFQMDRKDAKLAVKHSAMNALLEDDPNMVMHDSVETWAHDIYHEFRRNNGTNQNLAPRA
jgi:hypothetical protein